MVDANDGWAGGLAGIMFHYTGTEWESVPTTFDAPIQGLDMINSTSGWGVTFKGQVLRYNGVQWSVFGQPSAAPLDDIFMWDGVSGWAVGGIDSATGQGTILRWNGTSWQKVASGAAYWLKAIDFVNPNDGVIVGIGGTVSRWNGSVWSSASLDPSLLFFDVDMVSSTDIWVVGANGVIYHYNGSSFGPVDSPTTQNLHTVAMASADNGWAMGAGGLILHWDGVEWQVVPSPTAYDINELQMLSPINGWAVGKNGVMLHYQGSYDLSTSSKVVTPHDASAGEQLTYTISVKNTGEIPAPAVVVSDAIPLNTTYVPSSLQTSQGTVASLDPIVVNVGDVAPDAEVTITFRVLVSDLGLACWFIPNEALIGVEGTELSRRAVATIGTCNRNYLPLIQGLPR